MEEMRLKIEQRKYNIESTKRVEENSIRKQKLI
jgi:hypothetical protein